VLQYIAEGADGHGGLQKFGVSLMGQEHDPCLRSHFTYAAAGLQTTHARHGDIDDRHVHPEGTTLCGGLADLSPLTRKDSCRDWGFPEFHSASRGVIVHLSRE
jgi:hypothetical protein